MAEKNPGDDRPAGLRGLNAMDRAPRGDQSEPLASDSLVDPPGCPGCQCEECTLWRVRMRAYLKLVEEILGSLGVAPSWPPEPPQPDLRVVKATKARA